MHLESAAVFKNFANVTRNTRVGVPFLESCKPSGLQRYLKKTLSHRCFPVKFAKFLRTPILKNICLQAADSNHNKTSS